MAGWAERVAFTSGIGLFYQSDRRQAKAATPASVHSNTRFGTLRPFDQSAGAAGPPPAGKRRPQRGVPQMRMIDFDQSGQLD